MFLYILIGTIFAYQILSNPVAKPGNNIDPRHLQSFSHQIDRMDGPDWPFRGHFEKKKNTHTLYNSTRRPVSSHRVFCEKSTTSPKSTKSPTPYPGKLANKTGS